MKEKISLMIAATLGTVLAIVQSNVWLKESKIQMKPTESIIMDVDELPEAKKEHVPEVKEEPIEIEEVECVEIEKPYSDEELELLAHLLNGEAGASWCSDEMVFGVGSVALNRVSSSDFPNTLEEVIYQKGQYACTKDGNFEKEPTERCYQIAEELLLNGSVLPEDVVFQAEFKQGSEVYVQVQNMYFCRK